MFGALLVALISLVATVQVAQEALEGTLMFGSRFVVLLLEFCIAYVNLAVFAPVLGRGFPVFGHFGC